LRLVAVVAAPIQGLQQQRDIVAAAGPEAKAHTFSGCQNLFGALLVERDLGIAACGEDVVDEAPDRPLHLTDGVRAVQFHARLGDEVLV
jgi:hypothetical protein